MVTVDGAVNLDLPQALMSDRTVPVADLRGEVAVSVLSQVALGLVTEAVYRAHSRVRNAAAEAAWQDSVSGCDSAMRPRPRSGGADLAAVQVREVLAIPSSSPAGRTLVPALQDTAVLGSMKHRALPARD